jgi:hypothetical protein
VHLNPIGARLFGQKKLLPILQKAISEGTTFDPDPAVENLVGSGAAGFAGKLGFKGAAVEGEVPTGYRVAIERNIKLVSCSIEEGDHERNALNLTIIPADTNKAEYTLTRIVMPGLLVPDSLVEGDWVYAALSFGHIAGAGLAVARLFMALKDGNTLLQQTTGLWTSSAEFSRPNPLSLNTRWWIKTNPLQLPQGVSSANIGSTLEITSPKTAEPIHVRISSFMIRKIGDPR